MSDFLPTDYKVPEPSGKYMKLKQGENRFRVLSPAIVGYEGWTEPQGGKPIRKRVGDVFNTTEVDPETIKHFWAFFVWNFDEKKVQVLQLTQSTVMKPIASLSKNKNWGDPKGYTLVVEKSGEKLETKYIVNPEPPMPLEKEAVDVWDKIKGKVDLEVLFKGGDPFGDEKVEKDTNTEIKAEDIPF
jgi:hypothetical protein